MGLRRVGVGKPMAADVLPDWLFQLADLKGADNARNAFNVAGDIHCFSGFLLVDNTH